VTTDQSPTTSDLGERYLYTPDTAAVRTVTLPSMGESEDGGWFAITNASAYTIYVTASDTDYIGWPLLKILSVEMLPTSHILVRYDHSRTRWDIVSKTGPGQVRPNGSLMYFTCDSASLTAAGIAAVTDMFNRHALMIGGSTSQAYLGNFPDFSNGIPKYGSNCIYFDGSAGYGKLGVSADGCMFDSTSGDKTLSLWVYCDDETSGGEAIIEQYATADENWHLSRVATTNAIALYHETSGSADIDTSGGTLASGDWHHIAIVRVGSDVGVYLDGTQIIYDGAWTGYSLLSYTWLARLAAGGSNFDGCMDDIAIVNQNIFGAAPNSTPDDSFTAPSVALGLVM